MPSARRPVDVSKSIAVVLICTSNAQELHVNFYDSKEINSETNKKCQVLYMG